MNCERKKLQLMAKTKTTEINGLTKKGFLMPNKVSDSE